MLGKFEEEVLLATLQAGQGSLPSEVYARLDEAPGKTPAFGAVYTTLNRMAVKGLLEIVMKADDGGRQRRSFTVNATGERALKASMARINQLGGRRIMEALA